MHSFRRSKWILSALCLSFIVSASADWAQWRGPSQNGHVPASEEVPKGVWGVPERLWKVKVGEGFSSPVVAQGKVFVLDHQDGKEVLSALDSDSGKVLWHKAIDEAFKDKQGPAGPRSTPLVDGDRVYAQSCRGTVNCRSVDDGKLLWSLNFDKDFGAEFVGEVGQSQGASRHGNAGSPVVDGGRLILLPGSKMGAAVACVNKHTGKIIWKSQSGDMGYAPAVIASIHRVRQAVVFAADSLMGLSLEDGRLLWKTEIKTRYSRHVSTPIVSGNRVVVSSNEHGLYGFEIVKDGKGMKAKQVWLTKQAAMNFSSPVLVDGHIYGLGPNKQVVCVELKTGKLAWGKSGLIATAPNKAHASFLIMGDQVAMTSDIGELIFFKANPKRMELISRTQVSGQTWCSPAYAAGVLYVKDGVRNAGSVYAYRLVK